MSRTLSPCPDRKSNQTDRYPSIRGRHLFFCFITILLAACQSIPTDTPTPKPSSTAAAQETPSTVTSSTSTPTAMPTFTAVTTSPGLAPAAVQGGVAMIALPGQPQTLNPIIENDAALRELIPLIFDSLLQVDPVTAQLQPGLARNWSYSADGRQVTFQLPPNLKWSDGTALTAAAIADSLQATQHPALLSFSEINAPDDQTLTLTFADIDCGAVTTLAQLPLLPASQILEQAPAGSGPFIVTDWSDNQRTLTLSQNPNYHGDPPFLDGLTVRFLREADIDVALSEGQFDIIGPLQEAVRTPVDLTDIAYPAPQLIYIAINFNPRDEAPVAPQVRQALWQALDREAILAEALAGDGQLVAGSLLSGHWAANETLSPPPYNPDAARGLLAEAGLIDSDGDGWLDQNGERLEISIYLNGKNSLHQRIGWLASSYYRDLGLFAQANGIPPGDFIQVLFTHDFNLALFSWLIPTDPDQRVYWYSTKNTEGVGLNVASYNNAGLDDFLDQGVAVPGCQPLDRLKIYAQAQDILSQDRPVDFLLAPNRHLLIAKRLSGPQPGPFAPFTWNAAAWHLP